MIRWVLLSFLAATGSMPHPMIPIDVKEPVELFRQICFAGGGTFSRRQVQPVAFAKLPPSMRDYVRADKAGQHFRIFLFKHTAYLSVGLPRYTEVGNGHTCTLVARNLPLDETLAALDPTSKRINLGKSGKRISESIFTFDGYTYEVRLIGSDLTAIQSVVRDEGLAH